MVPSQEANGDNLGIFFFFFDFLRNNCMLSVFIRTAPSRQFNEYSLESPHRGNSNEYTQHTISR